MPAISSKPVPRVRPKAKRASIPVLWELEDVLVQLFTAAAIEDLTSTPEDRRAAIADHQADHGLSGPQMELELRQYGSLREANK